VGARTETKQYDFEVIRKTAARIELVKLTVKTLDN